MTPRTEQTLKEIAYYFDLQIKYVTDLPDNVLGFLEPGSNPHYIVVNAHKPRSDQALTVAHELGHYVLHLDRPRRNVVPGYLDYPWKSERIGQITQKIKTVIKRLVTPEWEADMWAFSLLWQIGAVDDLIAITEIYPRKKTIFWVS